MASLQPVSAGINPTPTRRTAARFVPPGNQTRSPHQRSLFRSYQGPGDCQPTQLRQQRPWFSSLPRGQLPRPAARHSEPCSPLSSGERHPSRCHYARCHWMWHSVHICQQLEAAAPSASIFSLQPLAGPELVKSSQEQRKISLEASLLCQRDIFRTLPLAHRLLHFSKTLLPLQGCCTMQQLREMPTPVPLPSGKKQHQDTWKRPSESWAGRKGGIKPSGKATYFH